MSETSELLVRIASALGIPAEAFSPRCEGMSDYGATPDEVAELIDAFRQIQDRQARRRCLSYVRSTAEQKRIR